LEFHNPSTLADLNSMPTKLEIEIGKPKLENRSSKFQKRKARHEIKTTKSKRYRPEGAAICAEEQLAQRASRGLGLGPETMY
jgi:hypothetical protein